MSELFDTPLGDNPWSAEEAIAFEQAMLDCARYEAALDPFKWRSVITGSTDGTLVFQILDDTGEVMASCTEIADHLSVLIGFSLALVATRRHIPSIPRVA